MNNTDIIQQFEERLREAGLVVPHIEPDGLIHRCGTQSKPNSKNGSYRVFLDAPANVWWRNWETDYTDFWCVKSDKQLTAAERETLNQRIAESRKLAAEELARRRTTAAKLAQFIWNSSPAATDDHPYLQRKEVPSFGLRLARDGRLVVPVLGETSKLQSLQFISSDGEKRFLRGGETHGGFFAIPAKDGAKDGPLLIAEGYATGASLHMATGFAVLISFCSGNLEAVSKLARSKYPEREIIVAADNDCLGKDGSPRDTNPGVESATRAAQAIDAKLAICPAHEGRSTDFNDLHLWRSLEAVRMAVEAASVPEVTEEPTDTDSVSQLSILPPPPPVPLGAFPPQIQALIQEAADAYVVPQQVPTAVLLALLSCMVGRTRAIEVKPGWREHGNLWLVVVAPSGLGKTPVSHAFFRPVEEMEIRRFKEWRVAYTDYQQALNDFNKTKLQDRGEAPQMPRRTQYYIDDSTVEALADALEQNPRGIMWRVDELSGMLSSFDRYSSSGKEGGTKSRLLSAYDCQSWKSNRRDANRNLHIPAACVSIFGGLQPGMVNRSFDGADQDSGFLPRFMFVRAEREKPALWSEAALSGPSRDVLRRVVETLDSYRLVEGENGQLLPVIVPMSHEARNTFIRWHDALACEGWADLTEGISDAVRQKLKSHALRLALLLHCLDAALAGTDARTPLSNNTMTRALLLADWIKINQGQVWRLFAGVQVKSSNPIERAIMESAVEVEDQIRADNWRVSNARLVDLVNEKLPAKVKPEQVGKVATSLGMGSCLVGEKRLRGKTLHPEMLELFKRTVSTVSPVSNPCGSTAPEARQFPAQPSQPSHLEDVYKVGRDSRDSSKSNCLTCSGVGGQHFETVETVETVPCNEVSKSDASEFEVWCQARGLSYDPATGGVAI